MKVNFCGSELPMLRFSCGSVDVLTIKLDDFSFTLPVLHGHVLQVIKDEHTSVFEYLSLVDLMRRPVKFKNVEL
jgi:hypothetical protein